MQSIVYVGAHTAVVLQDGTLAPRGEAIEVSDDVAEAYLDRDDFHSSGGAAPPPAPQDNADADRSDDDEEE